MKKTAVAVALAAATLSLVGGVANASTVGALAADETPLVRTQSSPLEDLDATEVAIAGSATVALIG